MKILIQLQSANATICLEGLSLALALASFDHEIQLLLSTDVGFSLLHHRNKKLSDMLKSLDLYNMPPAWLDFSYQDFFQFDKDLLAQLQCCPQQIDVSKFDNVIIC